MCVVDSTDGEEGHTDFYSDGSSESWGSDGSYGYVDSSGYMTYYSPDGCTWSGKEEEFMA